MGRDQGPAWIPGNSQWSGLMRSIPLGIDPILHCFTIVSFLHSSLKIKEKQSSRKQEKLRIRGRKKKREERKKRKKNQQFLYIFRDFHFISDFKDGSPNHLVLQCAELKGIWGVAEREKPWHCWQDTLQHLGYSSETCGQANLDALCWACKT